MNCSFDNSRKLKFKITDTLQCSMETEATHKLISKVSVHPKLPSKEAEERMLSAVDRLQQWNLEKCKKQAVRRSQRQLDLVEEEFHDLTFQPKLNAYDYQSVIQNDVFVEGYHKHLVRSNKINEKKMQLQNKMKKVFRTGSLWTPQVTAPITPSIKQGRIPIEGQSQQKESRFKMVIQQACVDPEYIDLSQCSQFQQCKQVINRHIKDLDI